MIDYTGRVKDNNEVFETTREVDAKKSNVHDPTRKYEPRLISVGEGLILKGLDEALSNANIGDKLNVEIPPEKAFGKRDENNIRMIPQRKLGDKADEVAAGDEIEIGGRKGTVRFVGSGRIQVDLNHRLAGRTLVYDVDVLKKLESDGDKIAALIKRWLPLEDGKIGNRLSGSELEIELPEEIYQIEALQTIKSGIARDIFRYVTTVKNIRFVEKYQAPQVVPEKKDVPEEQPKEAATAELTK
ncbi:MAG: peptidylprolyl isomerase [Nitrososphaera sp.]|nr:peptidylprolyl isomerase [Nitrososphaera sp.]